MMNWSALWRHRTRLLYFSQRLFNLDAEEMIAHASWGKKKETKKSNNGRELFELLQVWTLNWTGLKWWAIFALEFWVHWGQAISKTPTFGVYNFGLLVPFPNAIYITPSLPSYTLLSLLFLITLNSLIYQQLLTFQFDLFFNSSVWNFQLLEK